MWNEVFLMMKRVPDLRRKAAMFSPEDRFLSQGSLLGLASVLFNLKYSLDRAWKNTADPT